MSDSMIVGGDEVPKWDIALEGLAKEAYRMKGGALNIDDFHRLAVDNKIRFDDIMVTMFELCIHGEWQYIKDSAPVKITRETLDQLYVNARLQEKDLRGFTGEWRPVLRDSVATA